MDEIQHESKDEQQIIINKLKDSECVMEQEKIDKKVGGISEVERRNLVDVRQEKNKKVMTDFQMKTESIEI